MQSSSWKLSIPEPCGQDWNYMLPVENGRHCTRCSRTIVDFSKLGDAQLIRLLETKNGQLCGRLHRNQLDRLLTPQAQSAFRQLPGIVLTVLAASLTWPQALRAQENERRAEQTDTLTRPPQQGRQNLPAEEFVVKGTVIDRDTYEPLMGVKIIVRGTTKATLTDIDGRFQLMATGADLYDAKLRLDIIDPYSPDSLFVALDSGKLSGELVFALDTSMDEGIVMGIFVSEPQSRSLKYRWRRFWSGRFRKREHSY